MVNRPPPKTGGGIRNDDADGSVGPNSERSHSSQRGPRRGLEWSLRSLHKIDTSAQHFLSNYYGGDSDDDIPEEGLEESTAFEIFKSKETPGVAGTNESVWASLNAPLRTGVVDGKRTVFELLTNVTKPPETARSERTERKYIIRNSDRSGWEVRLRFWLMHFRLVSLTASFLGVFVAMNVAFAGMFYVLDEKCCGDQDFDFGQVFAFSVQTSTTIGYGGYTPQGMWSNFLVVILSYISTLINTLFAGLLFTKFVTPVVNIQFSDVMTLCNVNGVPCLSVRLGNADGYLNRLTDINVRLTYSYQIPYTDHNGEKKFFRQTEELSLLSNRQHGLLEVWTLRHVLDENSPLFALNFEEHPANKIYVFTLSTDAVQDLTKAAVNVQTQYAVEDIMIGHSFVNLMTIDDDNPHVVHMDYNRISETEPYPVWYPAKAGAYDTGEELSIKALKRWATA